MERESEKTKQVHNKRKIDLIILIEAILIIVLFVITVVVIIAVILSDNEFEGNSAIEDTNILTKEPYSITEYRELLGEFSIEIDTDTNNLDDEKILEIAYDILEEKLGIQNVEERYILEEILKDDYDIICRFQQQYEGLEIYAQGLTMSFDYDFTSVYLNGSYFDINSDMDVNFEIDKETIANKYEASSIKQIIYINDNYETYIAYYIEKANYDYDLIVGGKTGEVLKQVPNSTE